MANHDRQIIQSLFARLSDVEKQAPPRDADAEAFIKERVGQQPAAPYFMAQTIVMQEYALQQAQQRIETLERQAQERPTGYGGLFGNLFGGGRSGSRAMQPATPISQPPGGAVGGQLNRGGGGFMAGAAQTAMGVAGGVLLGNAIGGMFGSNEATAAESAPEATEDAAPGDDGGNPLDVGFGDDAEF
jgi:uncharacterized protein